MSRRRVEQHSRAIGVDSAQQRLVLGQRYLGHAVEDDLAPVDRAIHSDRVANVAGDELDVAQAVVGVVEIEHTHTVACGKQVSNEERPEVTAAAGDKACRHSWIPSPRHQRMLARMPSYSSTGGSYPRSTHAAEMSHAIVWFISPSTCSCC